MAPRAIFSNWLSRGIAVASAGAVIAGMFFLWPVLVSDVFTRETIAAWVSASGIWGAVLIVALMVVAVVASPLPSAPIAVAAGAAYGHVWGTALVALGAELGALIAFCISRWLGHATLRRRFGKQMNMGLLKSQNALMLTIFASRLMPFISFDMISYAAGLSALRFWRFALATLAGILPASFVLAHLGGEMAGPGGDKAYWAVLGLGLVTGLPILWVSWRRKKPETLPGQELGDL
jgi:uncharacterized membrane protein YdjX (TVP38/TMEM64 family)